MRDKEETVNWTCSAYQIGKSFVNKRISFTFFRVTLWTLHDFMSIVTAEMQFFKTNSEVAIN